MADRDETYSVRWGDWRRDACGAKSEKHVPVYERTS